MLKYSDKPVVERKPIAARPKPDMDRKELRKAIADRHSKTFEHLAK
ncbi:hypothetical protein [Allosphingosinicella vermicomposti]|nr:hypothetical protein [Allosphingosinicella vermicomposti]